MCAPNLAISVPYLTVKTLRSYSSRTSSLGMAPGSLVPRGILARHSLTATIQVSFIAVGLPTPRANAWLIRSCPHVAMHEGFIQWSPYGSRIALGMDIITDVTNLMSGKLLSTSSEKD